jgi:hypothetical protein
MHDSSALPLLLLTPHPCWVQLFLMLWVLLLRVTKMAGC